MDKTELHPEFLPYEAGSAEELLATGEPEAILHIYDQARYYALEHREAMVRGFWLSIHKRARQMILHKLSTGT